MSLAAQDRAAKHSFTHVLKDKTVYIMSSAYFCTLASLYANYFWLPTILSERGLHPMMAVGLISVVPHLAGALGMYLGARRSDLRGERRWHSVIPAVIAAVALSIGDLRSGDFIFSIACLTIANAMMNMAYVVFWAIPSEHLKGESAAGGIALINTIGVVGAFVSPIVIGWIRSSTNSTEASLLAASAVLLVSAILLTSREVM